jgi:phosphatidylglycerol:prolipoprotein diacylglycerol transferase
MYPVIFQFGFIQIYSYGLILVFAFWTFAFLLTQQALALKVANDFFWNFSLVILLSGILSARLAYIALNLRFFLDNPQEVFMLWHGGLVWYGGFLGGMLSGSIYLKRKKIPLLRAMDLIMPYVALSHSIGRIGCFLNGCCYGRFFIPAQLFSSFGLLIIFVILRLLQGRPRRQGFILACYLMAVSLERFIEEFLRGDSPRDFGGLTIFQVISIAVFLSGLFLWNIIFKSAKKTRESA